MMQDVVKIHDRDSVCIAVRPVKAGAVLAPDPGAALTALQDIPAGHKIALVDIPRGADVYKYGYPIGHATRDIARGEHVHLHNLGTNLSGKLEYRYTPVPSRMPAVADRGLAFQGYKRWNGDAGIRNELWVVPTVGCVNAIGQRIMDRFLTETAGTAASGTVPEGLDAVNVLTHPYGCGQEGYDYENTLNALALAVKHPNAGGVLVLSLGCEDVLIDVLKGALGEYDRERVRFLQTQDVEDEIEAGAALLHELYGKARQDRREPVPVSALRVGMECGGSDGFSGLTGNPLFGAFSDFLVSQGGSTVMAEVAEMFGSETILMDRAVDGQVFGKIVDMINGYKQYCLDLGATITGNPSPGNHEGGLTTIEDKALGCTQKGGEAPVVDVLGYARPITRSGFNLLWAPGSDTAGTTALGLCCQMVIFTTGRGTPYGGFIPTVKVATNTEMFRRKRRWNDFNAGLVVEGVAKDRMVQEFTDLVLAVAGGESTAAERAGFREFVIWKNGVSE